MEFLLELLLELGAELGLSLFGSILEAMLPSRWRHAPVLASLGYVLLGALGAWISALLWPHPLLRALPLRVVSFVAGPVLCAILMFILASTRVRRAQPRLATDGARHGFLLGLSYQLVRLLATG